MKTCCLVWEIPVIEGEHYNPIMNVIYMQKAKKFLNQLNRYFQDYMKEHPDTNVVEMDCVEGKKGESRSILTFTFRNCNLCLLYTSKR